MAVAVVIVSEMGEWESTVTCDFHLSGAGAGIGYRKVGTPGGRFDTVDGVAGRMRTGRAIFSITPLWSRKAESIVVVGPLICCATSCGSQIVRRPMHEGCSSRSVGVVGPSHLA